MGSPSLGSLGSQHLHAGPQPEAGGHLQPGHVHTASPASQKVLLHLPGPQLICKSAQWAGGFQAAGQHGPLGPCPDNAVTALRPRRGSGWAPAHAEAAKGVGSWQVGDSACVHTQDAQEAQGSQSGSSWLPGCLWGMGVASGKTPGFRRCHGGGQGTECGPRDREDRAETPEDGRQKEHCF